MNTKNNFASLQLEIEKLKVKENEAERTPKNNFTSLQLEIENLKVKENEVERTPKEFYFFATGN